MLHRTKVRVNTTGSNGSASGSAHSLEYVVGNILGIYYNSDAAAPSTSDFVVSEYNDESPQTFLTKANTNSDQWFYPRAPLVSGVDGSSLLGPVDYYQTDNQILVAIAQANPNETFDVTILWDDLK